jgi:hypothetical protein
MQSLNPHLTPLIADDVGRWGSGHEKEEMGAPDHVVVH